MGFYEGVHKNKQTSRKDLDPLLVIRSENISTERKKIEKEPSRGC